MFNRVQVQEIRNLVIKDHVKEYNNIRLNETDVSIFDHGDIITNLTESDEVVTVNDPIFRLGNPVNVWVHNQASGGIFNVAHKCIRSFKEAKIIGWRSIITKSGFYTSSSSFKESNLSRITSTLEDGYIPISENKIFYASSDFEPLAFHGIGLFLTYLEPGNHGSFLFRALPKLLYAINSGVAFDFIVVPDKSSALISILTLYGLQALPIFTCREAVNITFESLVVIDDFENGGCLDAKSFNRLQDISRLILSRFSNQAKEKFIKIYISRSLQRGFRPKYRPLVNELELEATMRKLGFEIIYPELLEFSCQIKLFANAEMIVGPSGSGMLNSIFSKPNSYVIDLESFTYTIRQHAMLYGSSLKKYGFVFGDYVTGDVSSEMVRSWRINIDAVAEGIERCK